MVGIVAVIRSAYQVGDDIGRKSLRNEQESVMHEGIGEGVGEADEEDFGAGV